MAVATKRSHVLVTLGVLFTVGGITRILPTTQASAEDKTAKVEMASLNASETPTATPAALEMTSKKPARSDEVCFTGEAAAALASDQKSLQNRADALQAQELALQSREQEINRKAEELAALQLTIDERWKTMTTSADEDITHLAQMYSAMKPDQAASIFNQMDPAFAAGFLRLMPSDQAGLILAGMQAEKAYVVSVKLASRNGDIRSAAPPR